MYNKGDKIQFKLVYSPFVTGLGTIKNSFSGKDVDCVYLVEIEEVTGYYSAGDKIFVFPFEVTKIVYFD